MSSSWRIRTLKAAGVRLIDCVHKTPAAQADGYPYVAIPDMKAGRIDFSKARKISDEDFIAWTRKARPQRDDVILSRRTNPGVIAVDDTETDFALGQNLVILRADGTEVHPPFLRWLCRGPEWWSEIDKYLNVGAVFSSLRCGDVPRFELTIPPMAEQIGIAETLGALDDKIEVNRRMAATLEEMARALYRSWFVDFDPVTARAEGRAPAHMDPATAALFPARFTDDGLPEGWTMGTLADLIEFNPKEKLHKGSISPYLDMKALPTRGLATEAPIDREFKSGTKFRDGDTLLARITPCLENGKTGLVDGLGDGVVGWGSTEFIVMRPRHGVSAFIPYCVARTRDFRNEAIGTMTGSSGRQRADAARVAMIAHARPTPAVLAAFSALVGPMLEKALVIGRENRTLAALRDTLLPKLMSGELRVREAETRIAEAV